MTLLVALLIGAAQAASPCLVYLTSVKSRGLELKAVRDGHSVGNLLYTVEDDQAYIAGVFVDPYERHTGVSTELIGHMLAREPHVQSVSAVLVLDNFEASGIKATEVTLFDRCAELIQNTPLYRALFRFGFQSVVECRHIRGMGSVTIRVAK